VPNFITLQDLEKASKNLTRIEDFLAVRRQWKLEPAGHEALSTIDAAAELVVRTIDPILDAHGITIEWDDQPSVELLPTSTFDSGRLAKMSDFMIQLGRWFEGHSQCTLERTAEPTLGQVYGSVGRIRKAVAKIIERSPYRQPTQERRGLSEVNEDSAPTPLPVADSEPASRVVPGTPTVAAGPRPAERTTAAAPPASSGARLVLEDTEQTPLLQTFKGETELTPEARERLDTFFGDHGVILSGYQLHKFEAEIERRIRSTPHGQVLVVKIGSIEGMPKPYFAYQAKDRQTAE
jgi:hypothetical protein